MRRATDHPFHGFRNIARFEKTAAGMELCGLFRVSALPNHAELCFVVLSGLDGRHTYRRAQQIGPQAITELPDESLAGRVYGIARRRELGGDRADIHDMAT